MNEATKAGHREHHIWGSVSYWLGSAASDREAASHVQVKVWTGMTTQLFAFCVANGICELAAHDLMRALDLAVEAGDRHARAEMRACMGIKEPRE